MSIGTKELLQQYFKIDESLVDLCLHVEEQLKDTFKSIDNICEFNQYKVINSMQQCKLSDIHFNTSTGYGYGDIGRDTLDELYAKVFRAEDALVRPHMVSGTHALALCYFGVLRPGDEVISVTGKPYDTLEKVIGIVGEGYGSLKEFGVVYKQVDLLESGDIDYVSIKNSITDKTKLISIQRSSGYGWRKAITIDSIEEIIRYVKSINSNIICMIDNCYGEFIETKEPSEVGADIVAGSLIKNPGGGLAATGGYIVGKKDLIEKISYRMTAPGLGRDCGSTFGVNRHIFQGLFFAPSVVSSAIKTAVFCGKVFEILGYEVCPKPTDRRSDIIQAVKFNDKDKLITFCQGIQKGAPVDSFAVPEPWDMPGYQNQVIMAAGAFVQGSSIELSADAPIREPYIAYLQGGLTWQHGKLGIMIATQGMIDKGYITL